MCVLELDQEMSEKLRDVLKRFESAPATDVNALVRALEAAAPKDEDRDQSQGMVGYLIEKIAHCLF